MIEIENPKNYCQTWNSRSQKYVLIRKGKGGGMTGDMSPEPFPEVPIKKAKPEPEKQEANESSETAKKSELEQSGTSSTTEQNEQPEEENNWGSFFGL